MKTCPLCEKEIEENVSSCECGHKFEKPAVTDTLQQDFKSPVLKKRNKKAVIISIAVLVICLIAGTVGGFFASQYVSVVRWSESFDPMLILKDDQLLCADASRPGAKPMLIADFEGDEEEMYFYYEHYMSPDNKKILYTNNYYIDEEYFESTYEIFLYDLVLQQQQIKIATDVSSFYVNEAFDTVTCLKGEGKDAVLCQYDMMGNETVVTENVENYSISADGGTIIYDTFDGEIYVYTKGAQPALVHKNSTILNVSEDFGSFLFVTDGGKLVDYDIAGKKKTLIDTGIDPESVSINFYEGKGYYFKPSASYNLADYLVDDMLESDKKIDSSSEEYQNKLMRDDIRQEIADKSYNSLGLEDLYYYDGEKATLIDKNVWTYVTDNRGNYEGCIYEKLESFKPQKVKMSELAPLIEKGEIYSFGNYLIENSGAFETSQYMCVGTKKSGKPEPEGVYSLDGFDYSREKNQVYVYGRQEEYSEFASVYKAEVKGEEWDFELVTDRAGYNEIYYTDKGDCIYAVSTDKQAKAYDEVPCNLYLNEEIIKENINGYIMWDYDWFIVQDYEKNSDGEYAYTVFEDDTVKSFTCPINVEDVYIERTEKGTYLISDGDRIFTSNGERIRTPIWSDGDYFLPDYPCTVFEESNLDFSEFFNDDIDF